MANKRYHYPPGPRGRAILGYLPEFRRDPLTFLTGLARNHGDVVYYKMVRQEMVLLNHPDYIRDVLTTHHRNFVKGRALQWSKRLLGEGLLTSEGDFHRRQRRIAQPAFHRQWISNYGAVMTGYALQMSDRWKEGGVVDIAQEMMHLTLSIASKTLFNADTESEAKEIGEAMTVSVEYFLRFMLPFADLLAKLPVPSTLRFRKAKRTLDATIYKMIRQRRESGEEKGDLLSMLLLARDEEGSGGMTDEQLRDEAMTLLLAGHETTANALTWTWYLLSQHPDIAAKLHRELDTVLAGEVPTVDHLSKLTYTEQVLAESMRLYPPAWLLGYRAVNDYQVDKYDIPARSIVLMSQYVMHRDPRYYPEPLLFNPERWTPEAKAKRPKFSYFPFGGGPRVCIGEPFAWMEGVLLIAALGQKWRFELVPNHPIELQPLITLRPKHGMKMVLRRR